MDVPEFKRKEKEKLLPSQRTNIFIYPDLGDP